MHVPVRLLLLFVMFWTASFAYGDKAAPPKTYTQATSDGTYIFVMIAPGDQTDTATKYKRSGLYPNDGTTTPVWTVDWFANTVHPHRDGIHLVRRGPWATSYESEAASFYANGKLIRSYAVDDLVTFPRLMPHSWSHFMWRAGTKFDEDNKTYTVTTKHGETYVFDITKGQIKSSLTIPKIALLSSVGLIVCVLGVWFWRRKWRRRHA